MNRAPRPRPCPVCREEFTPKRIGLKVTKCCLNASCVLDYAQGLRAKDFDRETKAMKKKFLEGDVKFQKAKAQKAFNEYIRVRDAELPCVSCDKPGDWNGQWHASHWKSRGARPDLAFNEDNVHKACSQCNLWLSGNPIPYRNELLLRIGEKRVAALEQDFGTAEKLDAIYYRAIHQKYTKKLKELKRSDILH